jgi:DNA-directed RNA polymerase specialized sigma24 family protein
MATIALLPDYQSWIDRVCATHDAIEYTCRHRLRDARLASQVSVQVVAGLVAKPGVFRYYGLPYSGRIARLAEARLAEAAEGRLRSACEWPELLDSLAQVPPEHQRVLVLTCVQGCDDEQLAAAMGCDLAAARAQRANTMTYLQELAARALPVPPKDG